MESTGSPNLYTHKTFLKLIKTNNLIKNWVKYVNRHLTRYTETSLVIKEMQITAMTRLYTSTQTAETKRLTIPSVSGTGNTGILLSCWWESKMAQSLQRTPGQFLLKAN